MIEIAILSNLKPCNEVRMYERFAISLAKTNKYAINIIGIASKKLPDNTHNIRFQQLQNTGRSFKNRLLSVVECYRLIKKVKPGIIISTTPQLLPALVFYKWLHRCKIIYDVQEDYYQNLRHLDVYKFPKSWILSTLVRGLEKITQPWIAHFILAEKCYEQSLPFIESRYTIIENKFADISVKGRDKNEKLTLLFSGIISSYSGIYTAIDFYKKLKNHTDYVNFRIIGFSYDERIQKELSLLAENEVDVTLIGIDHFVDHEEIIREIKSADLGIVCHQYNKVSKNKIPSKLYEYCYLQLPFVVQKNTHWDKVGKEIGPAIAVDFKEPNLPYIEEFMSNPRELSNKKDPYLSSWNSEEIKLVKLIKKIAKEL